MKIDGAGERPIINITNGAIKFNTVPKSTLTRYVFAMQFLSAESEVLEIGCGYGHGALLLSLWAKHVTGIDYSAEAIEAARKLFEQYPNHPVEVHELPGERLGELNHQFDIVTALEIIEHMDVAGGKVLIENAKKATKDTGAFIISTPFIDFRGPTYWKFHQHEYYLNELKGLLQHQFKHVKAFYQCGDGMVIVDSWWKALLNNPFSSDATMILVASEQPITIAGTEGESALYRAMRGIFRNAKALIFNR